MLYNRIKLVPTGLQTLSPCLHSDLESQGILQEITYS